jgi:hypothetical protein
MTAPWTLDKIRELDDPAELVAAVKQYDEQIAEKRTEAHRIRDAAILKLLADDGPTAVARRVGMSVSHVKLVQLIGNRS